MLLNFVRVVFCAEKAKHGLSLIISVRLPRVNNWYSGNVSGLERNGRWVQISCYSISSESFFCAEKAKHGLSLIISVRLPRVNNWYSGNVSGLERNGRWVQISCYSISSESFFCAENGQTSVKFNNFGAFTSC